MVAMEGVVDVRPVLVVSEAVVRPELSLAAVRGGVEKSDVAVASSADSLRMGDADDGGSGIAMFKGFAGLPSFGGMVLGSSQTSRRRSAKSARCSAREI